jgi:hypothetical protein
MPTEMPSSIPTYEPTRMPSVGAAGIPVSTPTASPMDVPTVNSLSTSSPSPASFTVQAVSSVIPTADPTLQVDAFSNPTPTAVVQQVDVKLSLDDPSSFDESRFLEAVAASGDLEMTSVEIVDVKMSTVVSYSFSGDDAEVSEGQMVAAIAAACGVPDSAVYVEFSTPGVGGRRLSATNVVATVTTDDATTAAQVTQRAQDTVALSTQLANLGVTDLEPPMLIEAPSTQVEVKLYVREEESTAAASSDAATVAVTTDSLQKQLMSSFGDSVTIQELAVIEMTAAPSAATVPAVPPETGTATASDSVASTTSQVTESEFAEGYGDMVAAGVVVAILACGVIFGIFASYIVKLRSRQLRKDIEGDTEAPTQTVAAESDKHCDRSSQLSKISTHVPSDQSDAEVTLAAYVPQTLVKNELLKNQQEPKQPCRMKSLDLVEAIPKLGQPPVPINTPPWSRNVHTPISTPPQHPSSVEDEDSCFPAAAAGTNSESPTADCPKAAAALVDCPKKNSGRCIARLS